MSEMSESEKIMSPKYMMRTPRYKGCLVCAKIPVVINSEDLLSL